MGSVWGAEHSLLPWLVKIVKLTRADTDVQAILQHGRVLYLAGWAKVGPIVPGMFNSLHYSDLARGAVAVEDWSGSVWVGLLVRAQVAGGRVVGHLVAAGQQPVLGLGGHSTH